YKSVPLKNDASVKKYWWDDSLCQAKTDSVTYHREWIAAGRPKIGDSFLKRNAARKKYKYLIHKTKADASKHVTNKLQNTLLNVKGSKFWRLWKANFKADNKSNDLNVNNLVDDVSIAEN